jgi:hypothetical protein
VWGERVLYLCSGDVVRVGEHKVEGLGDRNPAVHAGEGFRFLPKLSSAQSVFANKLRPTTYFDGGSLEC